MVAYEYQEQIAKDLCMKVFEKNYYFGSVDRTTMDDTAYNTFIGEQIGTMYQAILKKVCETNDVG